MSKALILFAHGSRDPGWAEPFERLAERVRSSAKGQDVRLAYLEIMQPTLEAAAAAAVSAGANSLGIVPIFLAQGGHVRRDLAALVEGLKRQHPNVQIECSPPAGEDDAVLRAIADFVLREAGS